jgi:DNA-binding PadR family transcriptional regulator
MMSNQETLILAILLQTERYGYEIDKILSGTLTGLWGGVARSSVYSVLTRLYRKRLVDYHEVARSGSPPRKLYSITAAGRARLEESIHRELSSDDRILGRFEIVLYAWPVLAEQERKELLSTYIGKLREREGYCRRGIQESINPTAAAFLERPLSLVTAEKEWLLRFAEQSGIVLDNEA